jgi:zinc transport system permease protein
MILEVLLYGMMDLWYRIVGIFPFEWAKPGEMFFMKNALLAILVITPIFGILGTMIVNKRMAFFSDALGHGAFTGVAIGALMGFLQPLWSAVIFAVVFSFGIAFIRYKSKMASDTVIGVFSSTAIALGIFLATAGGRSFNRLNAYLIGDILSISPLEIGMLFILLLCILIFWVLKFNKLLVVSINSSLAGSRGINIFWNEVIFSMAIAVTVTVSMSWIGLLVINSFLILPAAAARNIAMNQRQYHLITVVLSMISGVAGLILSYYIGTASGSTIVLITSIFFFLTFLVRKK